MRRQHLAAGAIVGAAEADGAGIRNAQHFCNRIGRSRRRSIYTNCQQNRTVSCRAIAIAHCRRRSRCRFIRLGRINGARVGGLHLRLPSRGGCRGKTVRTNDINGQLPNRRSGRNGNGGDAGASRAGYCSKRSRLVCASQRINLSRGNRTARKSDDNVSRDRWSNAPASRADCRGTCRYGQVDRRSR